MPLNARMHDDTLTIVISGRFEFSLHKEFRAVHDSSPAARHFVVDLTEATYMDSSALGMLLLLREWAQERAADVRILTHGGTVKKILGIANFEKLFRID